MALFENMSMDDYNKLQARYQQKQAQNTAQNLANRQAALNAAQKKSQGGLVDTLVGLATGIKDKVVDAGATLNNIGKTVAGGIDEIFANKANKDTMADDSKRRNDIAKKYGYNSYSDALNDDNASQDFWNEIKESNKTTQNKLKDTRKTYDKSYGNVQNVDLNMAKGQALNTVDTVLSVIPNPVADVAGAAIAGVGDEYKDASREKRDVNWRNAGKNATIGGISALASAGASKGLGKLANVSGPVGKIGGSQLVNGMGSGAAAGAAGGLAGTLANGGSIEDALANALQGAKGGALGGGVMAGTMGLAGKGIDNFRNKRSSAVNAEPVDAQVLAKNKIAQPQTKAIEAEIVEPVNNRRGIAIKDYNAGVENIPVRRVQDTQQRPTYYEYPELKSSNPVVIDDKGNYAVTDGINTIQTINGKVGTYNGGGEWNGARVFDGQDGRGLPNGFKIMADENAAPNNNYVAIINDAGEKALIKLPQASDYDYERIGLATGTTRESLADKGLTQTPGELFGGARQVEPIARKGRKYIDSVVDRAKANLPESKKTAAQILYDTTGGKYKDATHFIGGNTAADEGGYFGGYANDAIADIFPKDIVEALRKEAQATHANTVFAPYGMNSRQDLPMLNRQEYYADRTGRPGHQGLRAEDIPAYMQDRMRNDAGKSRYSSSDNETIMREVFGDVMDKEQMYDLYEQLAQTTTDPKIYSDENLAAALATDPELNRRATQILADQTKKQINVQGGPAISDTIPVTDRTTRYTESTLPARTYETPTARAEKVINAEPTAVEPTPTTTAVAEPEIDYGTQLARQKAQIAADKAKRQAIGGVIEQYGTTRLSDRIEGLPTAIEDMLDLGLTDRAEIELFSKKLASGDSEISKAIRTSLNEATPIDGKWGFTWEDVFNSAGAANNEAAQKQIKSFYDSQAKKILRADENGLFNRNDVYDFGKALEKEGYKKYDRGVRNQNTNTQVYGEALINMSQDIIGKATDGVDVSGKFNANKLKNLLPGNEAWANKVDALNANAKTVQDLRSAMASATKMNLLKQAEEYNMNTYGQNVGGKGKGSAAVKAAKSILTGKPLQAAEAGTELVLGSNKAKQKAIKKSYENYKKYQAQANGETPTTPTGKLSGVKQTIADKTGKVGETAKNIAGKAAEKIGNATADLNNTTAANIAIGGTNLGDIAQKMANRTIAQNQAEYAQNRAETAKAQQAVEDATNQYNTAQTLANNAMAATQQSTGTGATLDRIARAMDLAMQAGDMNAYGQLADLYKQAYSIYELQNPTSSKNAKALSANQSKALAASQQLEQLAQMAPDAGTVASNIPLVSSLVDLAGGNQYANQAEALATTLGYLLSGANIKESEAKRIGQSYVPTAFDSEAVRQQKLDRARQLIQSYMSDTGALEA